MAQFGIWVFHAGVVACWFTYSGIWAELGPVEGVTIEYGASEPEMQAM
jgi:hypothetical protein